MPTAMSTRRSSSSTARPYRNAWWPAAAGQRHFKPAMKDGRRVPLRDADRSRRLRSRPLKGTALPIGAKFGSVARHLESQCAEARSAELMPSLATCESGVSQRASTK